MERHHFTIAGHHVELAFAPSPHNSIALCPSLEPFRSSPTDAGQPLLSLTVDDGLKPVPRDQRHRIRVFDTGNGDTTVDRTPDGGYQFIIKDIDGRDCCLLQADSRFARCQCALNGNWPMRRFGLNNALMLTYAFAAASHQTLLLHASLVRKDGRGYAFTAKSGTGKSTQVSMWLRHLPGCDLMNDDNPVIRIIDGTPYIYGSPWSGKTPCYRNIRARLGAITRIDRDTTNHVTTLQPIEAFATILSGVSTMKWDETIHRACCDTVAALVEALPTYALHCLPNREAAEVCWRGIACKEEGGKRKEEGGKKKEEGGKRKEERGERTTKSGERTAKRGYSQARPHARATIQLRNDVLLPEVVRLLDSGHAVTLPLRGISMRPFLEDERDKAILVKATEPRVGDAVLAEIAPKTYVLHRLWAIDGDRVTLLGDGNLSPEHCRLADVKAVAIAFYRKGRSTPDRTDGRKWRAYSWLWTRLRPIRRLLLALYKRTRKGKR